VDLWWQLGQATRGVSGAATVLLAGAVIILVGRAIAALFQSLASVASHEVSIRRLGAAGAWVAVFTALGLVAALTLTALAGLMALAATILVIERRWDRAPQAIDLQPGL
jgi:hypothetical protein